MISTGSNHGFIESSILFHAMLKQVPLGSYTQAEPNGKEPSPIQVLLPPHLEV